MSLSDKQCEAVLWNDNKELLISAAAGSGKTTVLVARIIDRIIEKRVPIDQFLIVTFTHAAATELKQRLEKALSDELNKKPDDDWLALQVTNISKAAIGTMHAFCLKAIKDNHEHKAVNLPKSVKILSDDKKEELINEALDDVFDEEYEKGDEKFISLLNTYATYKNDSDLRTLVKNMYEFAIDNANPLGWLETCVHRGDDNPVNDVIADYFAKEAKELCNISAYTLENYPAEEPCKSENFLAEIKNILSAYADALEKREYAQAQKIIALFPRWSNKGKFNGQNILVQKNVINGIIEEKKKSLVCNLEADVSDMNEQLLKLSEMAKALYVRFGEKKQKSKAIDYNDMEHKVLDLLSDESVAELYSEHFSHILFDEYQDCSRIQELIMQKICKNARYFMVGDVKQSIYGFRQADPSLFINKYNSYCYGKNEVNAKIELNENYRSRKNVLNATNYVFFKIMKRDFGGIDYNSENALNARLDYPMSDFETFANDPVSVAIVKKNSQKGKTFGAEVLYTLREIKNIVGKKYVFDAKDKIYRPLQYSDIAILMRSNEPSKLEMLCEQLLKANIPCKIPHKDDMSYSTEINLLISLLRTVENPYNDIAMMTVLHSYIFGVSDTEMAKLMNSGLTNDKSIIAKVEAYIEGKNNNTVEVDNILAEKLEYFMLIYKKWVKKQEYMSVADFIDDLLDETAYLEYFGALENGKSRVENVNKFCMAIKSRLEYYSGGLFECATMLDGIDKSGFTVEGESGADNVVSVMTMHKSKGLEFPVVFVLECGKIFSKKSYEYNVLLHKDYGVVSKRIDAENRIKYDNPNFENMKFLLEKEQKEEEQRLLYVAMTRAREKLYIVGLPSKHTDVCFESLAHVGNVKNMMDWVVYALQTENSKIFDAVNLESLTDRVLTYNVDGADYPSIWKIDEITVQFKDEEKRNIYHINGEEVTAEQFREIPLERISAETNEQVIDDFFNVDVDDIIRKVSYVYPYSSATKLNSKLSVSQIKRITEKQLDSEDDEVPLYRKETVRVITTDETMTSARLGTLYHFFMQHMSLKAPYSDDDFYADVKSMLEKRLITEYESKYLKPNKFKAFFESNVGREVANAVKVEREKNFSYMLDAKDVYPDIDSDEKILIQGVIDCLVTTADNEHILIDYKTDRISPGEEDVLVNRHRKQIELYSLAVSDIEKIVVAKKYIYSFALEKFIEVK